MNALYSGWHPHKIIRIIIIFLVLAVGHNFAQNTGTPKTWGGWVYETQAPITGHAAYSVPTRNPIAIDTKRTYVNDYHGHTYALNKTTGALDWTHTTDNYSPYPPTVTNDGRVYIADFDARIYALDVRDGKEVWRFVIPGFIQPDTPVFITAHHVLFGARNGILYALDKDTGVLRWRFQIGSPPLYEQRVKESIIHFGMLTTTNNVVVINTPYKSLFVLREQDGGLIEQLPLSSYTQEAPALTYKEILMPDGNGKIIAIDQTSGLFKWKKELPSPKVTPLSTSSSSAYFVDAVNNAYILDGANGQTLLRMSLSEPNLCNLNTKYGPIVRILYNHAFIGEGNQLCSFSSETGQFHWQTAVSGKIHTISTANADTIMITSEKEGRTILTILSLHNGTAIDWAENVNLDPNTLLAYKNTWSFVSRDERKIFTVPQNSNSPYDRLERIKQCCRLGQPMPIPDKNLWVQTPKLFPEDISHVIYRNFRLFFNTAITTHTRVQPNISPPVFELTLTYNEKFLHDPTNDTKLTVSFRNKNKQTITVDGFYVDKNTWQARFLPPEQGPWSWTGCLHVGIRSLCKRGSVIAEDSRKISRPLSSKDIGFQDTMMDYNVDGNPINQWGSITNGPLETNTIKYTDMQSYFSTYRNHGNGFSLYRFGVDNGSFKLWKTISPTGNRYGINEGIWADQIMQTLKKNDYHIMMTIFGFEPPVTQIDTVGQRRALKGYLNFIIARYGAYVDIWELTNESMMSRAWIHFVASYIRSIDPYHRPITTSWQRPELDDIDINSIHWYDNDSARTIDTATQNVIDKASFWNKPVIISEQGNKDISWSPNSAMRLRIKLWISYLKKTSIIFWNQVRGKHMNPDNANIYLGQTELQYVASLKTIIGDTDLNGTVENIFTSHPFIHAYKLQSSDNIFIYLYQAQDVQTTISTRVHVDLSRDGTARWFNPSDGTTIESIHLSQGSHDIMTPYFSEDLVLLVLLNK